MRQPVKGGAQSRPAPHVTPERWAGSGRPESAWLPEDRAAARMLPHQGLGLYTFQEQLHFSAGVPWFFPPSMLRPCRAATVAWGAGTGFIFRAGRPPDHGLPDRSLPDCSLPSPSSPATPPSGPLRTPAFKIVRATVKSCRGREPGMPKLLFS